MIATASLEASERRARQLARRAERLEEENLRFIRNLKTQMKSQEIASFAAPNTLRFSSPGSPESINATITPQDTPSLPQRVIDEDYDEDYTMYRQRLAREHVDKVYGLNDNMDAEEAIDRISDQLSERWTISDRSQAYLPIPGFVYSQSQSPAFSPISIPSFF